MKAKFILLLILFTVVLSCKNRKDEIIIKKSELLEYLKIISHDSMQGRFFGTPGNLKAQKFIALEFEDIRLEPFASGGFIQKFSYTFQDEFRQQIYPVTDSLEGADKIPDTTVYGGNVIGIIRGNTDKTIIISAHHDHLGVQNGEIYNGADDNASGVVALISMAKYFKQNPPQHNLIFTALDGEEISSLGGKYFLENYPLPLNDIVMNINMDMISHNNKNELYACGTYHYPEFKPLLKKLSQDSAVQLKFGHDEPDNPAIDDWTYASDHRLFHEKDIPFIYFGVEDHKDYHQPTDTFENINSDFFLKAVETITKAVRILDQNI